MSKQGKIKAVMFDLGGTIIESVEPAEVFHKILEDHGVHVSIEKIREAHRKNQSEHDANDMAEQGMEYWDKWNARLLRRIGIDENREMLARRINEQWFDYAGLQVYPDAAETLEKLKLRKVKLGIVTNALEEEIQKIFEKLGLKNVFDLAVGCDSCRKAKPSREIFCYALEKLGVRPEDTVFVGDSLKYDYEGAEKAGIRPVLVNRNGDTLAGVETVRSLTEILKYVG
jgi:putative hydrolase of the HAD superfamily